jgi:uncharacterized membrane protein
MKTKQAQTGRRERGSALLLTLLLTLTGALILGLTVDATALIWVRSNAQTTANLAAAALAVELERNPDAALPYLVETARAAAARNGFAHGADTFAVHLEQQQGRTAILVERDAEIFFLRIVRPQPIAVRARAEVAPPAPKAGL